MKLFIQNILGLGVLLGLFLIAAVLQPAKANGSMVTTYDFITTDNGMQGLWATDNFHSTVTITPSEKEGCYEVVRQDGGTFESLTGAKSPGGKNGTLIGDGTTGTISGGITDIICGTLREEPLSNDTPEDLRTGKYATYEDKYFHRYFSEIESGNITSWGWTFTTCNNGTWKDNDETEAIYNSDGPNDQMGDITGDFVPCVRPTPTPTPGDVCWNLDGFQGSIPDGYHKDTPDGACNKFQYGGAPQGGNGGGTQQVLGASTVKGQVLGASTMAKTGGFEESVYEFIMGLGGIFTFKGLKDLKKTKKVSRKGK